MPHRVLTRPARVFEYSFAGAQKARGRENILRLEVRPSLQPQPHPQELLRLDRTWVYA